MQQKNSIRAWRGGTSTSSGEHSSLLRTNHTSNQKKSKGSLYPLDGADVSTKSRNDLVDRLHRSELAREQAETKLSEWMQVAAELQEVVQRQQMHLESDLQAHPLQGTHLSKTNVPYPPRPKKAPLLSPSGDEKPSTISQLRSLVESVRAGLEMAPSGASVVTAQGHGGATSKTALFDPVRLQGEIQSLRRQLEHIKQSQETSTSVQQEEAAALTAQLAAHRKATEEARGDHERVRMALLKAEMELQRAKGDVSSLHSQLETFRKENNGLQDQVACLTTEIEDLRCRAETAEAQATAALQGKEEAIKLATDATEEAGRLQAACEGKITELSAVQASLERATADLAASETRCANSEMLLEQERSKRGLLQARVSQLQSEVTMLEQALGDAGRKAKADVASFTAQLEALHEELAGAQQSARAARREADGTAERVAVLNQAHAASMAAYKAAQERLLAVEAEAEAALRRTAHAESGLAASSKAAAEAQRKVEEAAALTASRETEVRALKEVLDRVASSAQQKDAELQDMKAKYAAIQQERAHLIAALQNAEGRLVEVQAAAANEISRWEATLRESQDTALEISQSLQTGESPVMLHISIKETDWQEGNATPPALRHREAQRMRQLLEEHAAASASTRAEFEQAMIRERREHADAVRALEDAHREQLEAVASAAQEMRHKRESTSAQEEIAALQKEVEGLRTRGAEAASRLRAAERELLAAQDTAARLNSSIDKLQRKAKRHKEDWRMAREAQIKADKRVWALEKDMNNLQTRVRDADAAAHQAQMELADAQDEVEALLRARLQDLSRPPSIIDEEEAAEELEFDESNLRCVDEERRSPPTVHYNDIYAIQAAYSREYDDRSQGGDHVEEYEDGEPHEMLESPVQLPDEAESIRPLSYGAGPPASREASVHGMQRPVSVAEIVEEDVGARPSSGDGYVQIHVAHATRNDGIQPGPSGRTPSSSKVRSPLKKLAFLLRGRRSRSTKQADTPNEQSVWRRNGLYEGNFDNQVQ